MKRLVNCCLTVLLLMQVNPLNKTSGQSGYKYYFPIVFGGNNLAGKYGCTQTEFTVIRFRQEITLLADGRSEYRQEGYTSVPVGTWQYNPDTSEVTLTNHYPDVLLVVPPNILRFDQPTRPANYVCVKK